MTNLEQEYESEFFLYEEKCKGKDLTEIKSIIESLNSIISSAFPESNIVLFTNENDNQFVEFKSNIEQTDEYNSVDGTKIKELFSDYQDFLTARRFAKLRTVRDDNFDSDLKESRNVIFFGAPGTGKSYTMDTQYSDKTDKNSIRTTFHPDTDYSAFVGCYKPIEENDKITYKFVPQAFTNAYTQAWESFVKSPKSPEKTYLLIEEINRGNCAQIFGDIFQLLDRNEDGYSRYPITPDKDLQNYLIEAFKSVGDDDIPLEFKDIKSGKGMRIPPNMYILATMNTSDQSLFPMDSAFKRRWDWQYIQIQDAKLNHRIQVNTYYYDWWDFLTRINQRIEQVTESEDKQLGYWFAMVDKNKCISTRTFVSKVLFYLWNDVFKDYAKNINSPFTLGKGEQKSYIKFRSFFRSNGTIDSQVLEKFFENLGLVPLDLSTSFSEDNKRSNNTSKRFKSISSQEARDKKIRVTFKDGTVSENNNVTQTYREVIEKIGPDRVRDMRLANHVGGPDIATESEMIRRDAYALNQPLSNGCFLYTNLSTQSKYNILAVIADRCDDIANLELFE